MENRWDVIIVGGAAAGLSAAIYTCRKKMKTLIVTVDVGGQNLLTEQEENYPGYLEMSGPKLMQIFQEQAVKFGAEFVFGKAVKLDKVGDEFKVTVGNGEEYFGKIVILAFGKIARKLGVPNEDKFLGRGVHTCATCLTPGSQIVTNPSTSLIENVKKGDLVLTAEGEFRRVVESTKRKYTGEILNIKSRYFKEGLTNLTPNHPVFVTKSYSGYGQRWSNFQWETPSWVPAGVLSNDHVLIYPVLKETKNIKKIRISKILGFKAVDELVQNPYKTHSSVRVKNVQKIDESFCRLAGYFISEGSITSRGINFYFGPNDGKLVKETIMLIKNRFGVNPRINKEGNVTRIEVYSKIVGMFFEKMFGKYSYGKKLPAAFLKLPKRKQAELIKGIWRGDGSIGYKYFTIISNSPQLISQIKMILLRLGIIPSISKRSLRQLKGRGGSIGNRKLKFRHEKFEIRIGGQFLGKMSKILGIKHPLLDKRTRYNEFALHLGKFILLPIEKIERKKYAGYVYNMAVERSNTYVTHNSIVHNCDAPFAKGKVVAVVGGGNSAIEAAELLSKFASKVYLIHRRDEFRADPITVDKVKKLTNVEFVLNVEVREIKGEDKVKGVVVEDAKANKKREINLDSVFIEIGYILDTEWVKHLVKTNELGEIVVNKKTETSQPGIFAAGDVTDSPYKQTVTAAGEGAIAGLSAYNWLRGKEGKPAIKIDWD